MKLCLALAAAGLFLAGPARAADTAAPVATPPAATAAAPPSLDDFYTEATFDNAKLSPDGKSVLFSQGYKTEAGVQAYAVLVRDLDGTTARPVLKLAVRGASISWLDWKDDGRLLVGISLLDIIHEGGKSTGPVKAYSYGQYIMAIDRDGKNKIQLLKGGFWDSERGSRVELLDRLKDDPDHILAIAPNTTGLSAAWKVNVRTGEAVDIENARDDVVGWRTDSTGQIVVRYRESSGGAFIIESRAVGQTAWNLVATLKPKQAKALDDFEFFGPTEKTNEFYVAVKPKDKSEGDRTRLRIFDAATGKVSDPVWPEEKYDVAAIVYDGDSSRLAGVCFTVETFECKFTDKTLSAHYKGLMTYFDHERSIAPVSISKDGHWWLLSVSGPDQPGAYYLYNKAQTRVDLFADRYPILPSDKLARATTFQYVARDGVTIPAYVTAPARAVAGPMPMIVMPHGGPEVRDALEYNTWVQVLATQGYLVFQPNYRGSGGYGRAYAEAGYGQWGGRMADDVTDGVKALIKAGKVDPNRICIFGASYGGYAALFAGATHPELYKCVVSWAGDADLLASMRYERVIYGRDSDTYKYWLKSIGDPDKDSAAMRKASPSTYAATYQPPVLLIHGELDKTVDPEQSRTMNGLLRRAGRSVTLLEYDYEGHSGWDTDDEKAALRAVMKFIEAHIAPQPAPPAPTH